MAELVLIREQKSFEELSEQLALSSIQHLSNCIKLSPQDICTKPGRRHFITSS